MKSTKRLYKRCINCLITEYWYIRKVKDGWLWGCREAYDRRHIFELPKEEKKNEALHG